MAKRESGIHAIWEDREDLGRVIHAIISAASALTLNVECLIAKSVGNDDQALRDDTRSALDRVVILAREAQSLQRR
ncbi:MAG: hypothetical protein ACLP1X_31075 [Polyangiaceae bacterium]